MEASEEDVTCLICMHNTQQYVGRCLSSILYNHPRFQILVVDDGSTDRSLDVVYSFAEHHPQIKVLQKPNGGYVSALDFGFQHATTDIVTVVDSDDELLPFDPAPVLKAFLNPDMGFVWTNFQYVSGKTGFCKNLPKGQSLTEALLGGWWGSSHQKWFRRAYYPGLDLQFDRAADVQLSYQFGATGCEVLYIPMITYLYDDMRDGSLTKEGHDKQKEAKRLFLFNRKTEEHVGVLIKKEPRVLIGTMLAGEADYRLCCDAIYKQTVPAVHYVIEGKQETEAHHDLYRYFKDNPEFEYLLKVDADMVLRSPTVVEQLVEEMKRSPDLARLTHQVHDYFTDSNIWGIHFFSQKAQWDFDMLKASFSFFPDLCDSTYRFSKKFQGSKGMRRDIPKSLAYHCHHASPRQSFHYGFHRWLKRKDCAECRKTFHLWEMMPSDEKRYYACLGMLAGIESGGDLSAYCYGERFDGLFAAYVNTFPFDQQDRAKQHIVPILKEKMP